jgi:hypothetical protein
MSEAISDQFAPLDKLNKDVKRAAATMTNREARYLTDLYYQMQDNRIRAAGQIRSMEKGEEKEPHETISWVQTQNETLETSIKSVLGEFARNRDVGKWSQGICGIGPVISAGLIANIGLKVWEHVGDGAPCKYPTPCSPACGEKPVYTVSRIWRYAGLDPTVKWNKGQKRPWNASLKTLCWKIGQSFVKVSTNQNDFYGKFYQQRKALEIERNDRGVFADQAARVLSEKKIRKETDAWPWYAGCYPQGTMAAMYGLETAEQRKKHLAKIRVAAGEGVGMLPPAHIQQRAERYAVKLFLSHWHQVAFYSEFNEMPPKPYVLKELGHADQIQVPAWPF